MLMPIDLHCVNASFWVIDQPCPDWASGTRSLMILQASYTGVDGSNCIVFTTLHWRTQIFNDKATILEGIMASPPTHLKNTRAELLCKECVKSSRVDGLCYSRHQQAIIKKFSRTTTVESVKRQSQRQNIIPQGKEQIITIISSGTIFTCDIETMLQCILRLSSSSFFPAGLILKGYACGHLLPDCSACRISPRYVT